MRIPKKPKRTDVTKELIDRIVELYVDHKMTYSQIKRELGVGNMTIYRAIRAAGIETQVKQKSTNRFIYEGDEEERAAAMRIRFLLPRVRMDEDDKST